MITTASVEDFKCFKSTKVSLNNITLLLGTNSGGKSSFIQSLLLAKMLVDTKSTLNLIDNPYEINFGSFEDIINVDAESKFSFSYEDEKSGELAVECSEGEDLNIIKSEISGDKEVLKSKITFLGAERNISKIQVAGDLSNLTLGQNNKHLAYIMEKGKTKGKIPFYKERNHWESKETQLLDIQINEWLNFILPSNNVESVSHKYDHMYSLGFGNGPRPFKQANVGFGVSFILPIIVAGLTIQPNSVLIVENPELHLHPKAQSNIASFLASIASNGVQVIIETHSDHIVNGFRKAILSKNIGISNKELAIKYFDNIDGCKVEEISLNDKAEIENWPTGFMDQSEEDLFEIRKLRRQ